MRYYFMNETQSVVSETDIKRNYEEFKSEYESYSDYHSKCMYWNNGELTPIEEKIASVKREIARKEAFDSESDVEFFAEDISELRSFLDYLTSFVEE